MTSDSRYVVTAPYITVETQTVSGRQLVGLYEGATLPADVPADQVDHLLSVNLIGKVGSKDAAPAPATPSKPAGKS